MIIAVLLIQFISLGNIQDTKHPYDHIDTKGETIAMLRQFLFNVYAQTKTKPYYIT